MLSKLQLNEIEAKYNLSNLRQESLLANRFSQTSYELSSTSAEGQLEHYFFKGHRQEKNSQQLLAEITATEALRSSECLLIPPTIPCCDHKLFCVINNQFYSLHPFIKSDISYNWLESKWGEAEAQTAGKALATFHIAGQKLLSNNANKLNLLDSQKALVESLETNLENSITKLKTTNFDQEIFQQSQRLKQLLIKSLLQIKESASKSGQTKTIIHGDYHPGNLIFEQEEVKAIVDFDYIALGPKEYDLAYAGIMFAGNELSKIPSKATALEILLESRNVQSLLSGYTANKQSISEEQLNQQILLAAFVLLCWLIDHSSSDKDPEASLIQPLSNVFHLLSNLL